MKVSTALLPTSRREVPRYVRWFMDADVSTRKIIMVMLDRDVERDDKVVGL